MAELWLEPYEEGIGEFPVAGSASEQLTAAVRWATRAPSVHNTQPWRFRLAGRRLEVDLDPSRVLAEADPTGREATISCGAAIEYLHLTLRRFGFEAPVSEPSRSGALAVVSLGEPRRVDPTDRRLFEAMAARVTNRHRFARRAVPEPIIRRAIQRAAARGGRVVVARDPIDRAVLADFVAEADRIQMASLSFRKELAHWLRPLGMASADGIPFRAGKGPIVLKPVAPLVVRSFDIGKGLAAADRRLASGSPILATLWTPTDDRAGWVAAGRSLARVLLSLAADGVATSFLNQAIEVESIRGQLRDLYQRRGDYPQMVVRAGYGPPPGPPTPRRPVSEVLRVDSR